MTASLLGLAVASCGPGENDPGPGGVTVGEAKALDDAAEMLEDRQAKFGENDSGEEPAGEAVSPEESPAPQQ
ncbi:MAG: hypothetical protein R3E02_14435 [Blastomonas sp.]